MELDGFFTDDYTVDDFIDAVLTTPIQEDHTIIVSNPHPSILKQKSPRRKTFGALINELREEIKDLRLEIELRDAYINAMIHEIQTKK